MPSIVSLPLFVLGIFSSTFAANACSITALIAARPTNGMLVLARAEPDTVLVTTDTADFISNDRPSPEVLRARAPAAQRFTAIEVHGDGLPITSGSTFAAVPWAYGPDCSYIAWEGSTQWVPAGDEVLFRLIRTRRIDGQEPVVDVLGWHSPYPTGELWKYESRGEPVGNKDQWLTAREYYELILQLPTSEGVGGERRTLLREIERVFSQSDRWKTRFPGSTILNGYVGRSQN